MPREVYLDHHIDGESENRSRALDAVRIAEKAVVYKIFVKGDSYPKYEFVTSCKGICLFLASLSEEGLLSVGRLIEEEFRLSTSPELHIRTPYNRKGVYVTSPYSTEIRKTFHLSPGH